MQKLREVLDNLVEDTIRKRGYLYYLKGAVTILRYDFHKVTASVKGTMNYDVEIDFDDNKFPVQLLCSCPYNDTAVCKHIVATLYKLNDFNYFQLLAGRISFEED
ncbi:MAG: hypothetical protein WC557_06575, partial [Ignavibacteriaceae bacterium]